MKSHVLLAKISATLTGSSNRSHRIYTEEKYATVLEFVQNHFNTKSFSRPLRIDIQVNFFKIKRVYFFLSF